VTQGRDRTRHGLLIVNTGDGKGKTTAALGIALRAWGRDMKLEMFQFIKHSTGNWGEIRALKKMGVDITTMGAGFTWLSKDLNKDAAIAQSCWTVASQAILDGSSDIVVLDEFTYVLTRGWVAMEDALAVIQKRPPMRHVIVTGRSAPQGLIDAADLVTEMRKVKHPYDNKIGAQPGIEF